LFILYGYARPVCGQPVAINRQTVENNFNFFMGRANNVTEYVRPKYLLKTRHDFIGHPIFDSM
jgi:hypothetical protein